MKRLAVIIGFLLCAASASATNAVYIAATSAGGNTGVDCADAKAVSYFNTSGNWSATPSGIQIGPDTTVHLCGTFTGTTNTNILVFQGSGTSGHPVTLLWETGAILQEPYCPASGSGGCIQVAGKNYITLTGGTNGIIQNTANGTGLANQQASTAIENDGGTNFTIQNLTIQNIYVHNSTSDSVTGNSATNCVYDNGTATGWVIQNNVMHDMSWCINIQYNTTTGVTISGNNIYNVDHGIALGGPAGGYTLSTVNVFGNKIHDYSNWDTIANTYHHDGIHIWGNGDNASDTITGVNIYNNQFGGCIGQNFTAHEFIETNAGGTSNVYTYNNTFIDTCTGNSTNGFIAFGADGPFYTYNNTFLGASTDVCAGIAFSFSNTFVNNVVSGCGTLMYVVAPSSGVNFTAAALHNNIYANCSGSNCFVYHGTYSGSFATWQSGTGQDASPSAYTASAGLNTSGVPQPGSAVIGVGANLSGLGITPLDSDILGVTRTVPWDDGAYKYGTSPPPTPAAPVKPGILLMAKEK